MPWLLEHGTSWRNPFFPLLLLSRVFVTRIEMKPEHVTCALPTDLCSPHAQTTFILDTLPLPRLSFALFSHPKFSFLTRLQVPWGLWASLIFLYSVSHLAQLSTKTDTKCKSSLHCRWSIILRIFPKAQASAKNTFAENMCSVLNWICLNGAICSQAISETFKQFFTFKGTREWACPRGTETEQTWAHPMTQSHRKNVVWGLRTPTATSCRKYLWDITELKAWIPAT